MAQLTVLIGAPGSGKSTWAGRERGLHLASDDVRDSLVGDVDDHSRDPAVAAAFDALVLDAIRAGEDVIVENGDNPRRATYLGVAREHEARTRAVVFEDWDGARERALARPEPPFSEAAWQTLAGRSRAAAAVVGEEAWDEVVRIP